MVKSKYDFIKEMLVDKSINQNQRERIFNLASKELETSTIKDKKVIEEISKIKARLGMKEVGIEKPKQGGEIGEPNSENDTDSTDKYIWIPSYVNPIGIYKYLFDYNNDLMLKSTCHKIDSSELKTINKLCNTETYDFNKHLSKIIEAFEVHDKKYAPGFIKTFIRLYLTGEDFYGNKIGTPLKKNKLGWTEDAITFCWSDKKLKVWTDNNKGLPPCPSEGLARRNRNLGYELESSIKNSFQGNIKTFSQLILHFKKLFHIKSDNSLKDIIHHQNEIESWHERIHFIIKDDEFPSSIELFTYVERVVQAYKYIIRLIIEKSKEKPTVHLTFKEDEEAVYFTIHHLNSKFLKTRAGILERLHGQTYKNLIINQINGLCDLFVEAELESNEFVRFNIWDENYKSKKVNKKNILIDKYPIKISRSKEPFKGVSHILKFKKK